MRDHHTDSDQHASDLRDSMVQTRDIHEANSSLETLHIWENQIGDEGAVALAQALKASFVVSANCSCDRGRGTVGHQPTLCQLRDVFYCHARQVVGALYLTEPELQKCEQPSCHVTSVSVASACDGVIAYWSGAPVGSCTAAFSNAGHLQAFPTS